MRGGQGTRVAGGDGGWGPEASTETGKEMQGCAVAESCGRAVDNRARARAGGWSTGSALGGGQVRERQDQLCFRRSLGAGV